MAFAPPDVGLSLPWRHHFIQHAVGTDADLEFALEGLEVQVAGVVLLMAISSTMFTSLRTGALSARASAPVRFSTPFSRAAAAAPRLPGRQQHVANLLDNPKSNRDLRPSENMATHHGLLILASLVYCLEVGGYHVGITFSS
jgi:hypothetical protein